ncbi:MAG TPA: AmmeMemoRadiSam system protein A [Candidatus Nanoarchaeia archaeon]|nr:AmmeMemoRadiSam system protein A [Candidatus Nanoarchaeia archaeon]
MTHQLVELARKTLESYFQGEDFNPSKNIKEEYSEEKSSFVTITKKEELRGCIGSLEPIRGRPLWRDVQENTLKAAFSDPRFPPLVKEELSNVKIEVSVLGKPREVKFSSEEELLKKLDKKQGVILINKYTGQTSTFLPSVWEHLTNKKGFMNNLSVKAGLPPEKWKDPQEMRVLVYNVEKYKE